MIRSEILTPLWLIVIAIAGALLVSASEESVSPKRIVSLEYPWLARLARIEGKVELVVAVSDKGAVSQVRLLSGHHLLAEPAREVLSRWLFEACEKNKTCEIRISFVFRLEGQCKDSRCGTEFTIDLPNEVTIKSKALPPIID